MKRRSGRRTKKEGQDLGTENETESIGCVNETLLCMKKLATINSFWTKIK